MIAPKEARDWEEFQRALPGPIVSGEAHYVGGADLIQVEYARQKPDPAANKDRKTRHVHMVRTDASGEMHASTPVGGVSEGGPRMEKSPSGKFGIVFRKNDAGGDKSKGAAIDIFTDGRLEQTVRPPATVHGMVCTDPWFGGVAWSLDEAYVFYVAESGAVDRKSWWDGRDAGAKTEEDEEEGSSKKKNKVEKEGMLGGPRGALGRSSELEEDWGELYVGVKSPRLFALDVVAGRVEPVVGGGWSGLAVGQPAMAPDGRTIVFTAWNTLPRRFGLRACINRTCALFAVSVESTLQNLQDAASRAAKIDQSDIEHEPPKKRPSTTPTKVLCLTPQFAVSRCARFSPRGDELVFLGRRKGMSTHNGASEILSLTWSEDVFESARPLNGGDKDEATVPAWVINGAYPTGFPLPDPNFVDEGEDAGKDSLREGVAKMVMTTTKKDDTLEEGATSATAEKDDTLEEGATSATAENDDTLEEGVKKKDELVVWEGTLGVRVVVPLVEGEGCGEVEVWEQPGEMRFKADVFPGVFTATFPRRCWLGGGESIVCTSQWDSRTVVLVVRIHSGEVTLLPPGTGVLETASDDVRAENGSLIAVDVLAAFDDEDADHVVLVSSSPLCPDRIVVAKLEPSGAVQTTWTGPSDTGSKLESELGDLRWSVFSTAVPDEYTSDQVAQLTQRSLDRPSPSAAHLQSLASSIPESSRTSSFTSILLTPNPSSHPNPPLLVYPHGGPHGMSSTEFSGLAAFLTLHNFAVLFPNYRGSTGARDLDTLPGRCGSQDVCDCLLATAEASQRTGSERLGVTGGSHGGFLTLHLSATGHFLAGVARNPVFNIAGMASVTDIPDWCHVEAIGIHAWPPNPTKFHVPTATDYAAFLQASPAAHVPLIQCPVLLQVGGKDLRVPPSQSIECYHALRSQGTKTALLWYPEDSHPLASAATSIDSIIHLVRWLGKHAQEW